MNEELKNSSLFKIQAMVVVTIIETLAECESATIESIDAELVSTKMKLHKFFDGMFSVEDIVEIFQMLFAGALEIIKIARSDERMTPELLCEKMYRVINA